VGERRCEAAASSSAGAGEQLACEPEPEGKGSVSWPDSGTTMGRADP
jgi:hypothetical protein